MNPIEEISFLFGRMIGLGFRSLMSIISESSSRSLAEKFRQLGNLDGRTEDEITRFVGQPSQTETIQGVRYCTWNTSHLMVQLAFINGMFHSVTNEESTL